MQQLGSGVLIAMLVMLLVLRLSSETERSSSRDIVGLFYLVRDRACRRWGVVCLYYVLAEVGTAQQYQ